MKFNIYYGRGEDFSKQDLTEIQLRNRVNNAIKEKISAPLKN